MVRRLLLAAGMLLLVGGCGDSGAPTASRTPAPIASASATPKPKGPIGSKAPVLVKFTQQRPGALIDNITVHTDGYGLFDRPSGGVGRVLRDVVVDASVLRRLRTDLAALPRDVGKGDGSPSANGATYILRYRGRTYVARQGAEPEALREPMRLLAGTLVGDGISKFTRERLGGAAGSTHLSGVGKEKKAPVLVFCQRQGEGGATLDAITVRRDGTATLEKRHGGAGGRFKEQVLRKGVLPRLKARWRGCPPAQPDPRQPAAAVHAVHPPLPRADADRARGRDRAAGAAGGEAAGRPDQRRRHPRDHARARDAHVLASLARRAGAQRRSQLRRVSRRSVRARSRPAPQRTRSRPPPRATTRSGPPPRPCGRRPRPPSRTSAPGPPR